MATQNVAPGPAVPAVTIWLQPDGSSTPYMHVVDGECACKTCESKLRRIITL
jgi:hypothetical protein